MLLIWNIILTIIAVILILKIIHYYKLEKELKKEHLLFQTLIDSIPCQVFQKDAQLRYRRFNKAFETFSKTPRSKIIGKTIFDLFSPERAQKIHDRDLQFIASSNNQIHYETTLPDGNDEMRDYLVTKTKLYDDESQFNGFVSLAYDITDQKNLERSLVQANSDLNYQHQQTTASMEYASYIQRNILPEESLILEAFHQNIFTFFKPRNLVSGDFYWFAKKNNILLLAVADCTGHGIPSALMTVFGHSLFEHVVYEKEIIRPDLILEQLENKWRSALQKKDPQNEITDGMELALCAFDFESSQLLFSGAKRPLYHIHNQTLQQIDGSPFSIGGRRIKKNKVFELHTVSIAPNDVFYMSTDGFYDQLSGTEKRRFMSKNFKNLLFSIHHLSPQEQKQRLNSELQVWKGSKDQTDDILIIGIKI